MIRRENSSQKVNGVIFFEISNHVFKGPSRLLLFYIKAVLGL
jgi:hypothetical protein